MGKPTGSPGLIIPAVSSKPKPRYGTVRSSIARHGRMANEEVRQINLIRSRTDNPYQWKPRASHVRPIASEIPDATLDASLLVYSPFTVSLCFCMALDSDIGDFESK